MFGNVNKAFPFPIVFVPFEINPFNVGYTNNASNKNSKQNPKTNTENINQVFHFKSPFYMIIPLRIRLLISVNSSSVALTLMMCTESALMYPSHSPIVVYELVR